LVKNVEIKLYRRYGSLAVAQNYRKIWRDRI